MNFIDFPGTNKSFHKPEGTTDDQCGTLRVQTGVVKLGDSHFIINRSAWTPSDEEKRMINEGKPIYLDIFGSAHPMVSVSTYERDIISFEEFRKMQEERIKE